MKWVATRGGVSAVTAAKRFGIEHATSDVDQVLGDPSVNAVVIATRHDSHASLVCRAIQAGKHVFVEKPLALNRDQMQTVSRTLLSVRDTVAPAPIVMVGFNRRFAPHTQKIAELLQTVSEPKTFVMTVNAGAIAAEHWTQDPKIGGGRIIGECCHFVDLLRHMAGYPIVRIQAMQLGGRAQEFVRDDKVTVTMQFADGSIGTIHYLANGHRAFPKERLEIFAAGRVLQLDNFRRLTGCGWPFFRRMSAWRQDKGHHAEVKAFLDAVRTGGPSPIAWNELVEVTCVTMDIVTAAANGNTVRYMPEFDGVEAYLNESSAPKASVAA